jgi:NADPH2 dehydrogenase
MFQPFTVRGLVVKNRIVLPPMCQWVATPEGMATPYHTSHYGARAIGGTGMIIVEATAVEERGRISRHDLGAWSDEHLESLSGIARVISQFGTVPAVQLGHSGRKSRPEVGAGVAPSAVRFSDDYPIPEALSRDGIETVVRAFVDAARRAASAGFRAVELHSAHGYLLHQFLSAISNNRCDEYGGSLANRMRFPVTVAREVRKALPDDALLIVRVSAREYHPQGFTLDDMVEICTAHRDAGVDIIHVSSGGSTTVSPPQWPGYQLGFARAIRERVRVPTIGVGRLDVPELAEFALREGFCDLVAVGRAQLRDPNWPSRAALALGDQVPVPETLWPVFQPKA